MQTRYVSLVLAISFLAGLVLTETAHAAAYPGNRCAAAKLRAAGGKCRARLGAWAAFAIGGGINVTKRDTALGNATNRLRNSWEKAERAAAKKSVDCVDMTLANDDAQTQIDDVVDGIYTDIISGLNLSTKDEAKCSAALLKAAGKMCSTYFAKEAAYLQKLAAGKTKRDNGRAKALAALTATVNKQLAGNCPTTATLTSISTAVDHLVADITDKIIVSPNVDDTQFTMISPTENPGIRYGKDTLHPVCSYGTPYHYFVKRGSVNKLLIYYQGGGACWDLATCVNIQTFDKDVDPSSWDNPNYLFTGFGDLNNPLNPFKDWNIVFVPYCTGDIHFGDSSPYYGLQEIKHKGWHNARTVEKWAREHFLAPDEIFITGSSAGAYGAFFNAPAHHDVWPDSRISVLGDAGNGVITSSFLQNEFSNWNFEAHLPPQIPGIREAIVDGGGLAQYSQAVAHYYPNTAWAHYSTAYDGATGGQTGFYNVMLNLQNVLEWLNWWHATCQWHDVMVQQAYATASAAPGNYRYYIGAGSTHTMWGYDKVYTDTTGNVPTIVDWINAMRDRTMAWTNVECDTPAHCGTLLPGDPKPGTLPNPPFSQSGQDVIITCP